MRGSKILPVYQVVAHFYKYKFSLASILAIEICDGVPGGAGASEVVKDDGTRITKRSSQTILNQTNCLGEVENLCPE